MTRLFSFLTVVKMKELCEMMFCITVSETQWGNKILSVQREPYNPLMLEKTWNPPKFKASVGCLSDHWTASETSSLSVAFWNQQSDKHSFKGPLWTTTSNATGAVFLTAGPCFVCISCMRTMTHVHVCTWAMSWTRLLMFSRYSTCRQLVALMGQET